MYDDEGVQLPVTPPVEPMLAKAQAAVPAGVWSYEPKWDGFRALVFRDGDEVVVNGDRAEANVTSYMAYDPEMRSTRSFDLQFRDDQWKICQSS